jgi:multiple sugar transport system substrate-binding protein
VNHTSWEEQLREEVPFAERRSQVNAMKVMNRLERNHRRRLTISPLAIAGATAALVCAGVWAGFHYNGFPAAPSTGPSLSAAVRSSVPAPMEGTLKVSLPDEMNFKSNYGDEIRKQFPKLQISFSDKLEDVKGNYFDEFEKMIDREKPDLIVIYSIPQYRQLASHGKLLDLSDKLRSDGVDLDGMVPAVVNTLKDSDGDIYGLAPTFDGRALYYNKSLFDRYKVPYPTNGMTWDDVMKLARKFPAMDDAKSRIYGFSEEYMPMFSSSYFVDMIAHTNGLSYTDEGAKKMTMESREWNQALHLALDAYRDGIVPAPSTYDIQNHRVEQKDQQAMDLFSQGKAAMTLDTVGMMDRIKGKGFEYGIVSAPIDPKAPDVNTTLLPGPIFAVNARSDKAAEAWEIVKYVNRNPLETQDKTHYYEVSTHLDALRINFGGKLEPFFAQPGADTRRTVYSYNPSLPDSFAGQFQALFDEQSNAVLTGKSTVEEAQRQLQLQGQALLDAGK